MLSKPSRLKKNYNRTKNIFAIAGVCFIGYYSYNYYHYLNDYNYSSEKYSLEYFKEIINRIKNKDSYINEKKDPGVVSKPLDPDVSKKKSDTPSLIKPSAPPVGNKISEPETTSTLSSNELVMAKPTVSKADLMEDSFNTFNNFRKSLGLNEVLEDKSLKYAADAHAVFLVNNRMSGHYESDESQYVSYFGDSPHERMLKAGLNTSGINSTGEVLSVYSANTTEGQGELLEGLFEAIYHRFGMIDPDLSKVGLEERSGNNFTALVMDTVVLRGDSDLIGVSYPFDGQINVRTYFEHKLESPDPIPESKGLVGFAISFSVGSKHSLNVSNFTLKEKKTGRNIEGKSLMPGSEEEIGNNNFAFIPLKPLKHKTIYIAHIEGVADDSTKIDYSWNFTTK